MCMFRSVYQTFTHMLSIYVSSHFCLSACFSPPLVPQSLSVSLFLHICIYIYPCSLLLFVFGVNENHCSPQFHPVMVEELVMEIIKGVWLKNKLLFLPATSQKQCPNDADPRGPATKKCEICPMSWHWGHQPQKNPLLRKKGGKPSKKRRILKKKRGESLKKKGRIGFTSPCHLLLLGRCSGENCFSRNWFRRKMRGKKADLHFFLRFWPFLAFLCGQTTFFLWNPIFFNKKMLERVNRD